MKPGPRQFCVSRRVHFSETDLAGVMHFSNYLRWMEDVEHAFWRALGMSVHFEDAGAATSWPRVAVRCEYFAPARFEDEIELRLSVEKIGDKSLTIAVEFNKAEQRIAAASETAVCCRLSGGKFTPVTIPAKVRARLEAFERGEVG